MMEKLQRERRAIVPKECAKPLVKDLNQHIICPLCRGYLIDAITLVECLHSFCRGCIVQRFRESPKTCPQCSTIAVAPLVPDIALQRLVYLVVPGLFRKEQERRHNFRKINPHCSNVNQQPLGAPDLSFDDLVSLSLSEIGSTSGGSTRYLKCPAGVTVRHLLRLLMLKRGWDNNHGNNQCGNNKIEIIYDDSANDTKNEAGLLDLSWTLMDLACIFEWKREAPMKLLYRVVRVGDVATNKSITNFCTSNTSDATNQAIENILRPPTPPPSPKPAIYRGDSLSKNPRSTIVVDQYESKKPRCEVSPLMRAPDPPPIHDRSRSSKLAKLEHKRKKRKNKRVIAEITTTPREDLLKLKVRLTPVPTRVPSSAGDGSHSKDKLLQMRAVRKDKTKSIELQKHNISKDHKVSLEIEEENVVSERESGSTDAQKPVSSPEKLANSADSEKQTEPKVENENHRPSEDLEKDETPKNEEVLRRLGLVAISEANKTRQEQSRNSMQCGSEKADPAAEREKLEKQLRESKANRVRSLLAEKQMRDTLKSIMSSAKETNSSTTTASSSASPAPRCETPTPSSLKRKDPPPLTPLRSAKRPNVTFAPGSFTSGKLESPLDLRCPPSNALDLSSNVSDGTTTAANVEHKPVSILRNSGNRTADKPKDETKLPQESNLKTTPDAAVSLIGNKLGPQVDKSVKLTQNFIASSSIGGPMIGGKVALRIPQPHQRLTGFGMKIKPSIGVRHIPNPQAVVASQYRNQRTGYFSLAHQPP
ncbi:polycomb group protein Psc-like [Phymastichus coffea]|uniref:polycomb group protein Psc-like n=1 Tax=Phymastichus coffea TaxID=108790 RepID=UPI00273C828E|nr:polycomb group protein Psc-like [Phymastichus coffea]